MYPVGWPRRNRDLLSDIERGRTAYVSELLRAYNIVISESWAGNDGWIPGGGDDVTCADEQSSATE